jgi:hypothetical protein
MIASMLQQYGLMLKLATSSVTSRLQDLDQLCAKDMPPMPTFTLDDAKNFVLGPAFMRAGGTSDKIDALLDNFLWDRYCICSNGTQPPPIAAPALPPEVGFGSNVSQLSCYDAGWAGDLPVAVQFPSGSELEMGERLLPVIPGRAPIQHAYNGYTYTLWPTRPGISHLHTITQMPVPVDPNSTLTPVIQFDLWASTQAHIKSWSIAGKNPGHTAELNFEIDANTAYMSCFGLLNAGLIPGGVQDPISSTNWQWYCGGDGTAAPSDCCPPDPDLMITLSNVLDVVLDIQRALASPAGVYVDGARHANLSGTGSVVLGAKTVAVRVETHPPIPTTIVVPGTPDYYYDMGFVTPYILGSPLRGTRVTFNPHTVTLPTYTDQLGYTLRGGVLVDIVELERGPSGA